MKPDRRPNLHVAGIDQMNASLRRIEEDQHVTNALLQEQNELLGALFQRGETMADTLDDIRGNVTDLGVDLDGLISTAAGLRADLAAAMDRAGVDETARAEINATIDGFQQKIRDAIDPAVPVPEPDPNVPPGDLGDLGGGTEEPPAG